LAKRSRVSQFGSLCFRAFILNWTGHMAILSFSIHQTSPEKCPLATGEISFRIGIDIE
jgi:hypothetical protein